MTARLVQVGRYWVPTHGRGIWVYARSIGLFLAVWFVVSVSVSNEFIMPGPHAVLPRLAGLATSGELLEQLLVTLRRVLIGFALAAAAGIGVGVLTTVFRPVGTFTDPLVEIIRPISPIIWIPLFLALFGIGEFLPICVIFYAAFFPILVATESSLRRAPTNLINAARAFGAGRRIVTFEVVIPSALPGLLTGLRIALGLAWANIVAAELIGSASGVGFAVEWNRQLFMPANVLAWMAAIGVIGFVADRLLVRVSRALTPWSPSSEDVRIGD